MIVLPNINEDGCPVAATPGCPDARCSDPTFASQHPDICGASPFLVLKPAISTVCAPGTVQFTTFLEGSNGEQQMTSGVLYTSSNPSVVAVDPYTGIGTVIGPGIATITAQAGSLGAFGQVNVPGVGNCCAAVQVSTVVLQDTSQSMGQTFSLLSGSLGQVANDLVMAHINALNTKDQLCVASFDDVVDLQEDWDNIAATLISGLNFPLSDAGHTNIKTAVEFGLAKLLTGTGIRKVIFLVTDGVSEPPLSSDDTAALVAETDAFKSSGGIMIVCGVRAAGSGYTLLQRIASPGFFLNVTNDTQVTTGESLVNAFPSFYCGGTCSYPSVPYGSCTQGQNVPPQNPDPAPLPDVEAGESAAFSSTKTVCLGCPAGTVQVGGGTSLVPHMTSNTTPAGVASASVASTGVYDAWGAFDGTNTIPNNAAIPGDTIWATPEGINALPAWLQYKFAAAVTVTWYGITASSGIPGAPTDWTFAGSNDGSTWTTLDSRSGVSFGPSNGTTKLLAINNPGSYLYYRLNVTAAYSGSTKVSIIELSLFGAGQGQVCATATATSTVSQADADAKATAAATSAAQSLASQNLVCVPSNNGQGIAINDPIQNGLVAPATPYPSAQVVTGKTGVITKVTVAITGFSHTYPKDVGIVLCSPKGTCVGLMTDCGLSFAVQGINLVFDDAAGSSLPTNATLVSGTFKPTQSGAEPNFPHPCPAGPYQTTLAAFNGENANGGWTLWVIDDTPLDAGSIGSWSVTITSA